jgi:hypothetical protein
VTINIRSSTFPTWTQLEAPTPDRPYWHETEDGARHHLVDVLAGLPPDETTQIRSMHAQAIAALILAGMRARDARDHQRARALAHSAARLCEETIGLWPPSAVAPR